jgi:cupin fold WbuC family metalloprotein
MACLVNYAAKMVSMSAAIHLIDAKLFSRVLEQAAASPRRRMNFNFHPSLDDNPHRFLNVMLCGTYIQPHRHLDPPKAESFLVLEGEAALFIFDEHGSIERRHTLGPHAEAFGIDIPPGVWHSLAVLSDHVVCFEVKPGPYTKVSDKEFAEWAPREGDPEAGPYLESLLSKVNP